MPLTNDIELNGVAFNVVPGAYKKGLRKPLAVSKPARRRTGTTVFGPFDRGVLQAADDDEERGWSSLTVGPVFDGEGVEPFPNSATHADAMLDTPTTTLRAYGCVAGTNAFVGIGRRIYKSVLLTNGTWASFTVATDLGAGFTISGLSYFQDDILLSFSTGQDIRKFNTTSNAVTVWRAGEKSKFGVAYAGQFIYAPCAANNQEELRLSGTKWNGNAVTHFRYLDAPIINMASFNGQVVIATRKSLYFMGGQPYPGEADDAAITGDSSRAPEWRGDPDPVMGHGVFAEGDDFTFLESYRGRLYTWLGGRVAEFDDSTEEANWRRMGPEGVRSFGACVAGDWLIVAVESRYGAYEAWGFDGQGWWLLLQRSVAPAVIWPVTLAGAGNRDALLFRDGSLTYDLLRLRWRSSTVHTYATSGEWVSSLVDGDDPTADKAWTRIGATFASPGTRGNAASVDSVSFPLEYSIDGGMSWVTVEDTPAASGATRVLTRGVGYASAPISRYLQLRQRWSSVSDWAPVLTRIWVEYENAEDYALAELARTAYEEELAREGTLRRRWEFTVAASDRNVKRDGQLDAKTGRQAITALWNAWELGTELDFKDIDNDFDPVTYLVQIVGMEEKAAKPADGARWGESTVTLVLEESTSGVGTGLLHGHSLASLSDVTLGVLLDGHVLTYDAIAGEWVNEPASSHSPVSVLDSGSIDLTLIGQQIQAAAVFGSVAGSVAEGNHVHASDIAAGIYQSADFTGANVATAQKLFSTADAPNGELEVLANTTYQFRMVFRLTCAGVTSATLALLFGGTATLTSIGLMSIGGLANTDLTATVHTSHWVDAATAHTIANASGALAKFEHFMVDGIVRVNAGGTLIPQYQWNAAPGAVPITKANSYVEMRARRRHA